MPVQSKQYGDQSDAIELLKLRPGEVCFSGQEALKGYTDIKLTQHIIL